jgi:hypothetical protein
VQFNFNALPGTPQAVIDGFSDAAEIWSDLLFDDVTINIDIAFASLGVGILGSTVSAFHQVEFSDLVDSLVDDRTSSEDVEATSNLPTGSFLDLYINRTANNPNGAGSATPYVDNDDDANNEILEITRANAKAIGLVAASSTVDDGSITFSSNFSWDFDASDGITPGSYDFVSVAAHEIGHVLGFTSGVDVLDQNSESPDYYNDNIFAFVSSLDLFRYSDDSVTAGVNDWTADARDKYFSIDGGATAIATFATGYVHGDGNQASHWEDGLGIGLMDPSLAAGVAGAISNTDILAMDVIGWNQLIPPSVLNVTIGSSLSGSDPYAFDGAVGSGEQLKTVPVGLANQISVQFSEDVDISSGDLDFIALNRVVTEPAVSAFVAPSSGNNFTAIWTLSSSLPAAQYLLRLSDTIEDLNGNALDGEWTNPTTLTSTGSSDFPSGNDIVGGDFEFVFTILPGDADRDNSVGGDDFSLILANWGETGQEWGDGDFDGNGTVGGSDYDFLLGNWGMDFSNLSILADYNNNYALDSSDEDDFVDYYGSSNLLADLNDDGNVTSADLDAALALFEFGIDLDVV